MDGGNLRHIYYGEGQHPIPHDHLAWNPDGPESREGGPRTSPSRGQCCLKRVPHAIWGPVLNERKHAVWLPTFLERYDPDTIRYHLTVNMPELHDTDFTWREYVDKVNNELIGTYANYVNRVLTLVARASDAGSNPLKGLPGLEGYPEFRTFIEGKISGSMESMERQRFKEALRKVRTRSKRETASFKGPNHGSTSNPISHLTERRPSNPYQPHGTASGCSRYSLIHSCHSSPRGYGG